jgi:hypothetical protein
MAMTLKRFFVVVDSSGREFGAKLRVVFVVLLA